MEVLPPSGTSCIRQWLITSRSQWCIWDALMFYKKISFCFVYLSFFFLYVCVWFILFPMMLKDDACTHLHGVTECVTFLFQLLLELQAVERQIQRAFWMYGTVPAIFTAIPCLFGMWHIPPSSASRVSRESGSAAECVPQVLKTGWGIFQPSPDIFIATHPEELGHFWNHLQIYMVF